MECRIFLLLLVTITLVLNISQTWSRKAKYRIGVVPNSNAEIYYVDDSVINPWAAPSRYYIRYSQPRPITRGRLNYRIWLLLEATAVFNIILLRREEVFADYLGTVEGRSGINRLQQTSPSDDIRQEDYVQTIQSKWCIITNTQVCLHAFWLVFESE
jgi:hypothetical protein